MPKVVVIGGGITGLAAAFALEEARREGGAVDYLLLEKELRLGGKILTHKERGFVMEGGPDCFVAEKPAVAELSSRLGIADRLLPSNEENRGTYVYSGGKLHRLPEGLMLMVPTRIWPFAVSPLISWPGKLRMALDLFLPRGREEDESLGNFVRRRLGREALEKIAEPLIGGIHAGDPDRMSLKASFPRFLEMEKKYGSLIRAMLAARRRRPSPAAQGRPGSTFFMSFTGGMADLTDALAARLPAGHLLPGRTAVRVEEGVSHPFTVRLENGERLEADAVIVAVLADQAASLLEGLDREMAALLYSIPLASSATVNLAYRSDTLPFYPSSFGFVVPAAEKRRIMAVTYTSAKWRYRTPGREEVLLRAFVGGSASRELVEADEHELEEVVRSELRDILGITASPTICRVFRWPRSMPQYTMGHLDRVARLEELAAARPGLFLAGASYRGIGTPDCVTSGLQAARGALATLGKK